MTYHWVALLGFATALLLHCLFIYRRRYLSRKYSLPPMLIGFASLTTFLVSKGLAIQACPIGNPFEIVTLIVWYSVFFYLILSLLYSINYLGFFTSVLSTVTLIVLHLLPSLNYSYNASDIHTSHIVGTHVALAVFSYGVFALLSLLALMYLVQFYGLASRKSGSFFSLLPPLVKLEKLEIWILAIGVFVLSCSLFIGSFSFFYDLGDVPIYKVTATVLLWLIYLVVLILRLLNRLVASRFAWLLVIGFVAALLALIPVDRARHERMQESPPVVVE